MIVLESELHDAAEAARRVSHGALPFWLTSPGDGDVAIVTCEENILTDIEDPEGGLGGSQKVLSTNVFRRRQQGWRLWLHHASPVLAPSEQHRESPDE